MRPASLAFVLALLLALAAPAAASNRTFTFEVPSPGPGPAATDAVRVTKIGPSGARTILVLAPGFQGGAGDFALVGRDLVRRVPGLAVWAVDRRSQALEDTGVFARALAGRLSVRAAYDYYLGWLADPRITRHVRLVDESRAGYARRWGLRTTLGDLRRVVRRAARGGRRVLLGGHSLGASLATIYAAWDFGGRPGFRDVDGLVLVDGGTLGSFTVPDLARTRRALARLRAGSPFADLLGVGLPWAAGVFAQVAALAAVREPAAPSILQGFPLLPADVRPPVPATNRGALGYAFDRDTSPPGLALIRVNAGRLGADGDWVDGDVTPIARLARAFAGRPNAVEWYFPERLRIDVDAARSLRRDAQTRLLGLRPYHLRDVDVPVYAYQTDLTGGRVLRGARRFVARSRSPRRLARFVDGARTDSHLDPLVAAPSRSRFLRTVAPWLRRLVP